MPPDHRCARPGCLEALPGYMLACRTHWRALPASLRFAIAAAWNRRRAHPADEGLVVAHMELVGEAIGFWMAAA
jgi:hypothetical protein